LQLKKTCHKPYGRAEIYHDMFNLLFYKRILNLICVCGD